MDTQRITISLPEYLYKQIIAAVPPRKVSSFVVKAVEDKLLCMPKSSHDAVESFLELRKKVPRFKRAEIKAAIMKGRE